MATEQIVDLFSLESTAKKGRRTSQEAKSSTDKISGSSFKVALDNLESLWDSSQYEAEYDVDKFVESLESSSWCTCKVPGKLRFRCFGFNFVQFWKIRYVFYFFLSVIKNRSGWVYLLRKEFT